MASEHLTTASKLGGGMTQVMKVCVCQAYEKPMIEIETEIAMNTFDHLSRFRNTIQWALLERHVVL